jgi:hypothetical protein
MKCYGTPILHAAAKVYKLRLERHAGIWQSVKGLLKRTGLINVSKPLLNWILTV